MSLLNHPDRLRCSFCDKTQRQTEYLIAGPRDAFICNECVDICNEIIAEAKAGPKSGDEPCRDSK